MSIERPSNQEPAVEEELSLETIKKLVNFWSKNVVESGSQPEELGNDHLRKWLYETLVEDMAKLDKEWGVIPDENLIARIKEEHDPNKKAELEIEYLNYLKEMVRKLEEKFKASPDDDSVPAWNSYPKRIKENKDFNCVGGTLIGIPLLKAAGVDQYHGKPAGHAVNVVKTSNGKWIYLDLKNNKLVEIKSNEQEIDGRRVFTLNDRETAETGYGFLAVEPIDGIPSSIIGNFNSLIGHAHDDEKEPPPYKQEHTKKVFEKLKADLIGIDFGEIDFSLYPRSEKVSELRGKDGIIFKTVEKIQKSYQKYAENLSENERQTLMQEALSDPRKIIQILPVNGNYEDVVFENNTLNDLKDMVRKELDEVKATDPEIFDEVVKRTAFAFQRVLKRG